MTEQTDSDEAPHRRADGARSALIEAAARLLPDRAPSTIAGRELAAEAGVNYGLVHHHFGGKDAVLAAGLTALREEFQRTHPDPGAMGLLADADDGYLRALVRSQIDYPDTIPLDDDYPIGTALVESVLSRLTAGSAAATTPGAATAEAKARAIALVSLQLGFGVFRSVLLDAMRVGHRERRAVEACLSRLYAGLALLDQPTG